MAALRCARAACDPLEAAVSIVRDIPELVIQIPWLLMHSYITMVDTPRILILFTNFLPPDVRWDANCAMILTYDGGSLADTGGRAASHVPGARPPAKRENSSILQQLAPDRLIYNAGGRADGRCTRAVVAPARNLPTLLTRPAAVDSRHP
ncbi:hypothetical protein EVAR_57816_1 [Eumeta japonica]|uniref:Uncharacterized protein n=1 Tax=Eumeta variegata TaxID=151549 RepID=A0A4C1ZAL4_EUMVA|nr:hypothetical protein EVAR_57816_1 [Eumeta japonica]